MASGSQNNTTYQAQKWTNLRAFTIGNTAKNVDGTAAVSWDKDEILGASTDAYFLRGDKVWSNTLNGVLLLPKGLKTGSRVSDSGSGIVIDNDGGIEIFHTSTPFIDFHYQASTADYSVRLMCDSATNIHDSGSFTAEKYITAGTYVYAGTYLQAKNHIYMDTGHFYMKYNNTWYSVLHNHGNGNISVEAASGGLYIGYSNTTLVNWMDGRMQLKDGCLSIFPNNGNYREGIRIHSVGSWSDITLCGNDNTGDSGTSANSWFIGNNNGNFYISRNASSGGSGLRCVSNMWSVANMSTSSAAYSTAALQIREYNHGGAQSDNWQTAPRLGFHWSNRNAAQIGLASNGYLYECPGTGTTFYKLMYESGTWGISITGSSASCTGNALTCSYPYGFSSKTDNATWGNTTGTSIVSWNDSTGGSIAFRRDNPSAGKMSVKVDGRFYGNEGTYPAMLMRYENSYWGLCDPDAANNVWIRTTTAGIIPYQSGGASAGHCGLGTSSWYFASAYIQNIYGYLHGNISGSSTSCTGNAATATTAASCSGNAATATTLKTARNLWGNSFNGSAAVDGTITLGDEKPVIAKITRKKSGGGGWAFTLLQVKDNAGTDFAHFGVYGIANALSYIYIGANDYNSTANLRIDGSGNLTAPKFTGAVVGNVTGNCSGSAGSVAWANVSSKPATATRWPSWSEVTSKPAVQNNLTSTSTTDMLSAAQGKALNDNKTAKGTGLAYTTLLNQTYSGTSFKSITVSNISSYNALHFACYFPNWWRGSMLIPVSEFKSHGVTIFFMINNSTPEYANFKYISDTSIQISTDNGHSLVFRIWGAKTS